MNTLLNDQEFMVDLERACQLVFAPGAGIRECNLALNIFDDLGKKFDYPHPRFMVLINYALVRCLSDALYRAEEKGERPGIYVIGYSNGTVKIGRTAFFEARLRQLSTQGGLYVERSEFFPCARMVAAEIAAHAELCSLRVNGEFFSLDFNIAAERVSKIAKEYNQ